MISVADSIVKCLQAEDVRVVFGYPGAASARYMTA